MWLSMTLYASSDCNLQIAFDQRDCTRQIYVYKGSAEPASGNTEPLLFVSSLKVNTDGTRISYKVDDPRAQHGAINDIRNALHTGATIEQFQAAAAADWEPVDKTWNILSSAVIEKDTKLHKTGKPCVMSDGYLVSKTADVAVADGWARDGDCDQTKWIDALTIPALVLPKSSPFQPRRAVTRSLVVAMTLDQNRIAYGIVGDAGPSNKLGEASVEMNRILTGLPAGMVPANRADAKLRFQGPASLIIVFTGNENRLAYPITPQRVHDLAKARFDAWGGQDRLKACAGNMTSMSH
jgi:hypothetical protein